MDRLNSRSCIRYLLPYPINNLSYILFFLFFTIFFCIELSKSFHLMMCSLLLLKYVWKFETYKLVCLYFSIVFLNSLIYRYIAIVYVYRYVWKQNKLKNGKPVRKRIAFVTLPFFLNLYLSLCSLLLSFSRYFVAGLSGWFLFFWCQTFLFLCILINMIFCFSMFYYPYCCLIFIILLTLWKISWMFENMYFVKLFTSKHEKPKTC